MAANSSYRAWANTFTTKECDDLRSQWNFFFAYWEEEKKKQSVILHAGLQSLTHSRGNNRTSQMCCSRGSKNSFYYQWTLLLGLVFCFFWFHTFFNRLNVKTCQSWQEKGSWNVGMRTGQVSLLRSPAAWPRRRTDRGCSWADSSRCERRWARRSSPLPSEGASCCKRRPGEARLQTTDRCLSHIQNTWPVVVFVSFFFFFLLSAL